jgi:tetratricopeptide (TPR) repeat protein
MESKLLYHDIEGDLIQINEKEGSQLVKQITSTNSKEKLYGDVNDLSIYLDDVVEKTGCNSKTGNYEIFYKRDIIPLTTSSILEIIDPCEEFSDWRFTKFALDISESLLSFQMLKLPLSLIHPSRIGVFKGKFIVLPTLPKSLPRFEEIAKGKELDWMFYLDPEILRTRAFFERSGSDFIQIFIKADVYSLGKIFQVFFSENFKFQPISDFFSYIEKTVENIEIRHDILEDEFKVKMQNLIDRMCSPIPQNRPELEEVISELKQFYAQSEPAFVVNDLIRKSKLSKLNQIAKELLKEKPYGLFDFYEAEKLLLLKNIELLKKPCDHGKAISYLDKYLNINPANVEVLIEIARIYKEYTSNSLHLENSINYLKRAADISDWQNDIVNVLVEILQVYPKTEKKLELTLEIPLNKRTPDIFLIRIEANLQLQRYTDAWYEIGTFFEKFGSDGKAEYLANEIIKNLDALTIKEWFHLSKTKVDYLVELAYKRMAELGY